MFAVTSGRPPKGMQMLIGLLDIQSPIAGFNGGIFVDRDMTVIEQKVLPRDLVVPIAQVISSFRPGRVGLSEGRLVCPQSGRLPCQSRVDDRPV
jgi:hydroxymethylpyrimidine pyrophosphatase-like HAD family hydrolase